MRTTQQHTFEDAIPQKAERALRMYIATLEVMLILFDFLQNLESTTHILPLGATFAWPL